MTDVPGSSPSASQTTVTPVNSATRNTGLKWFASEFAVVVAGILVALGLQAWWKNHQDSSRGAEYLQQILSDVRVTERTLRASIAIDRANYSATKLLSTALYSSDVPTRDQAAQWLQIFTGWTADPRPILGNANALIQTGEIRLVSNPKARRAIISYASIMGATWEDRDAQSARMVRANDLALARQEAADLPPLVATLSETGRYDQKDLQDHLPAYLAAWPRLRADEQFRTAQQLRLMAYMNIEYYNQEMLTATTDLRESLETIAP